MKPYSSSAMTAPRSATRSKENVVEATIGPTTGVPGPAGQRGRVDRPRGEAELALAHGRRPSPSRSGSVATGGGSKASPAAAAPSRSPSPSPMWSARSGATPSRSSAMRKTAASGLATPDLGGADDLGEVPGETGALEMAVEARCPSSRRRPAPARRRGAGRAPPRRRAAAGRRCWRGRPGRTPPDRALPRRARGRPPCTAAPGRPGSRRPCPRACAAGSRRPRRGRPPRPRSRSRSTPRSASACRSRGAGSSSSTIVPIASTVTASSSLALVEGIRVQRPGHSLERLGDVGAGALDEVGGEDAEGRRSRRR